MANEHSDDPNPLTQLFPLLVGGYAWQIHGFWWGVFACAVYVAVTIVANMLYMYRMSVMSDDSDADPIRGFQRIKWLVFIFTLVGITGTA